MKLQGQNIGSILELSASCFQLKSKSLDEPKLFTWLVKCFMDEWSDLLQEEAIFTIVYFAYLTFFVSLQTESVGVKRC